MSDSVVDFAGLREMLRTRRMDLERKFQESKQAFVASNETDGLALQCANHWGGRVDEIDYILGVITHSNDIVLNLLDAGTPLPGHPA
jgi:hypothetical protein